MRSVILLFCIITLLSFCSKSQSQLWTAFVSSISHQRDLANIEEEVFVFPITACSSCLASYRSFLEGYQGEQPLSIIAIATTSKSAQAFFYAYKDRVNLYPYSFAFIEEAGIQVDQPLLLSLSENSKVRQISLLEYQELENIIE